MRFSLSIRVRVISLLSSLLIMAIACKNQSSKEEFPIETDTTLLKGTSREQLSAQNVFNTMPGKQVITELINTHHIEYNVDYVNDPTRMNDYNTESKRAFNLGVYGTDLIIASTFDQTQETMAFLKAVNSLASNLGVSAAFNQNMVDRMEANKENRDSTLEIVAGAFKKADNWLKENNRPATSALIVCGTWVEALYVATCYLNPKTDKELMVAILKQRESLVSLITLLNTTQSTPDIAEVKSTLERLKTDFDMANGQGSDTSAFMQSIANTTKSFRSKWVN